MGLGFFVHAVAGIADCKQNVVSGIDVLLLRRIWDANILRLDCQPSPTRHSITGVHCQVHQDLLDLAGINFYAPNLGFGNKAEFDVFADQAGEHLIHVGDDVVQVEDLRLHDLTAAEG